MLKHLRQHQHHLETITGEHLRTPSNGLSDSGHSEQQQLQRRVWTPASHVAQRPPISSMPPHPSHHHVANGYVSPGRYSNVGSKVSQAQPPPPPPLHVSMLNASKHSLSPTASVSPGTGGNQTKTTLTNLDQSRDDSLPLNFSGGPLSSSVFVPDRSVHHANHTYVSNSAGLNKSSALPATTGSSGNVAAGMHIRRGSPLPASMSRLAAATRHVSASVIGVREMLTSLGLLCLLSLMMTLLGLVFLMKMSPPPDAIHFIGQVRVVSPDEAAAVYEVSIALCSLAMTLDVCCCLVCATQLMFAARLITASSYSASNSSRDRIKRFLRDSAVTRICAVAGFFVSIPVFLTDIVLYTILQFPSTPAISTSIVISVGIVLCGCAMLHNILVWQRHKSPSLSSLGSVLPELSIIHRHPHHPDAGPAGGIGGKLVMSPSQMPPATLDLSALNGNLNANLSGHMLELSTLV